MTEPVRYAATGVDIDATDAAKRRMAEAVDVGDPRVFNRLGAFASLVDGRFPRFDEPVLVLKTDEPGSKQKLAFEFDRVESLCEDLINHLLNDVAVMGAHPLYVLDCIVCGRFDADVVHRLVAGMATACRAQEAVLVGGETSVQPGVVQPGLYVLSASAVGVAERTQIVDGSAIRPGDVVLAVASSGLHTNGYTLVRALLEREPSLAHRQLEGGAFVDLVMRPHTCYYRAARGLFGRPGLRGLAHITGGGVRDNLVRILPTMVDAHLDLGALRIPEIFAVIRDEGTVSDEDMLRTFNLGCGLLVVCAVDEAEAVSAHFQGEGHDCWTVGRISEGTGQVLLEGELPW